MHICLHVLTCMPAHATICNCVHTHVVYIGYKKHLCTIFSWNIQCKLFLFCIEYSINKNSVFDTVHNKPTAKLWYLQSNYICSANYFAKYSVHLVKIELFSQIIMSDTCRSF